MLSPVEQIKDRLSIVDVISSYLKLEKAGQNFKARCPFHNEKTPSFFVSPTRGSYHCFGCNRGGDIFTFVEDIEGASFTEALKTLALRAGVTLTTAGNKEREENKKSYDLLEATTKFFETNLLRNEEVKNYIKGRGLKEEIVRNFRLGFALDGWSNLLDYLKSKGYSEKLMEENGLIIKGNRGFYDRFRGRIMFPLSDSQGRIVGFSGRIFSSGSPASSGLEAGLPNAPEQAKYVNSPETVLYNKSKILYGYDKAKREMLKENFCVIVEGQMDLLMAHQAGTVNTVAVSGTALTEEHIRLIKRFTDKILMSFDADDAGLKAGERGVGLALASDMDVRMVGMPQGLDPADVILKDPAIWQKALQSSKHIVDFLLDHIQEKNLDERSYQREIEKNVLKYVADISNKIDQAHFIKKISEQIALPEESVRAQVEKMLAERGFRRKEIRPHEPSPGVARGAKSLRRAIEEKILGIYLWKPDIEEVKTGYERITNLKIEEEINKLTPVAKNDLIFQAEMYYKGEKALEDEVNELLNNFEKETLEESLSGLMTRLRKAEEEKDEEEAKKIFSLCHEISQKINQIKNSRFLEK